VGEQEPIPRSGHADVEEPALFYVGDIRAVLVACKPEREQAVLAADQEDHAELQALGGVQGEERDPIGPRIPGVDLGRGRDLAEEAAEVMIRAQGERQEELQRRVDVGLREAQGRGDRAVGGDRHLFPKPRRGLLEASRKQPRGRRSAERPRERLDGSALFETAVRALLERHARSGERLAKRPGLGSHAVQDRKIGEGVVQPAPA
jgi:hypothetical protein